MGPWPLGNHLPTVKAMKSLPVTPRDRSWLSISETAQRTRETPHALPLSRVWRAGDSEATPRCPSLGKQMRKMWCILTTEYCVQFETPPHIPECTLVVSRGNKKEEKNQTESYNTEWSCSLKASTNTEQHDVFCKDSCTFENMYQLR